MKGLFHLFFILLICGLAISCQKEPVLPAPPPEVKLFGGENEQSAFDLLQDADGSLWLAGGEFVPASNVHNILLVHTNMNGDELERFYFDEGADEVAQKIIRTRDGGYLVGGIIVQDAPTSFLLKLDAQMTKEWFHSYESASMGSIEDIALMGEHSNGFVMASCKGRDGFDLFSIDLSGVQTGLTVIRDRFPSPPFSCAIRNLKGGYSFLAFETTERRQPQLYEADSLGHLIFSTSLDFLLEFSSELRAFGQFPDSQYFAGENRGDGMSWLTFSPDGQEIRRRQASTTDSYTTSVTIRNDFQYFVAGLSDNPQAYLQTETLDFFIAEYDSTGNQIHRYLVQGNRQDWISGGMILENGSFAAVGHTDSFNENHSEMMLVMPWQ